jgi:hypothetical protein
MDSDGTVLGVIVAVIGVIGAVLVAWMSTSRPARRSDPPGPAVEGAPPVGHEGLLVSPEIWTHFSGRIGGLEAKVDHLTELVEHQTERNTLLDKWLRMAMRIIRRQARTLRQNGLPQEQIPQELIPFSID